MDITLMPFTINEEAPKAQLVTMGQANKEVEMPKEISYETHPDRYHYPPGTTEPVLKPEGGDLISQEPADKQGPVGATEKPKPAADSRPKKK